MSNENRNVAKTRRYKEKRQITKMYLDLYLDDPRQVKIYEWYKSFPKGKSKEAILVAIETAMEGEK